MKSMVEINQSFEHGDTIKVVREVLQYEGDGTEKRVERENIGEIVAKPSVKFNYPTDDFDFDYELTDGKAIRSIDIENEVVAQLMYDAGGDRDWKVWKLLKIERVE
jgi:hypothetical protein